MNKEFVKKWSRRGGSLVLVAMVAAGCSSMEDRITNVVSHELEQCRNSDEDFYTVEGLDGEYEILTEACEAELGEVEMQTDYRGIVNSGPLLWTAREEGQAVAVKRVGWYALDRALEEADRSEPTVEQLERAEEFFARAQDEFEQGLWVRQRRLENLVQLQAETMSADTEDVVGEKVREYLEEFLGWLDEGDDFEAEARARLTVVSHLEGHINRQERSIEGLGSGDARLRAAAQHAEDDGDMEEARAIRADLEERIEERPKRKATIQGRIVNARRQKCELTDGLHVGDIDDGVLRQRITTLMSDRDCDFDEEEEIAEDGDE